MSPLDLRKLKMYRDEFGELSMEEALKLAEEAENFYTSMSILDPARTHFWQERERLLNYAALLDLAGKENQPIG